MEEILTEELQKYQEFMKKVLINIKEPTINEKRKAEGLPPINLKEANMHLVFQETLDSIEESLCQYEQENKLVITTEQLGNLWEHACTEVGIYS